MAFMRARGHEPDAKVTAVRQLLTARGMDPRDFEVDEDARSGISQLLGVSGGVLTLRRRSTGEMRVYASGPGSAWFAAISADLGRGYFRAPPNPARRAGGPSAPWWRGLSRAAGAAAR